MAQSALEAGWRATVCGVVSCRAEDIAYERQGLVRALNAPLRALTAEPSARQRRGGKEVGTILN
jgi:hypothetical protein